MSSNELSRGVLGNLSQLTELNLTANKFRSSVRITSRDGCAAPFTSWRISCNSNMATVHIFSTLRSVDAICLLGIREDLTRKEDADVPTLLRRILLAF